VSFYSDNSFIINKSEGGSGFEPKRGWRRAFESQVPNNVHFNWPREPHWRNRDTIRTQRLPELHTLLGCASERSRPLTSSGVFRLRPPPWNVPDERYRWLGWVGDWVGLLSDQSTVRRIITDFARCGSTYTALGLMSASSLAVDCLNPMTLCSVALSASIMCFRVDAQRIGGWS
jgi:hypothetical protein